MKILNNSLSNVNWGTGKLSLEKRLIFHKKTVKLDKLERRYLILETFSFIFCTECVLFRFIMYQLSKNLNRPFFMEFLTSISLKYASTGLAMEDPEDEGDNLLTMLLKPSYTTQDSNNLNNNYVLHDGDS